MNAEIFFGVRRRKEFPQDLIHVLGQERSERGHQFAHGQENGSENVQRDETIVQTGFAFEAFLVQFHVPVGEHVNVFDQTRNDGVQPIGVHLLLDEVQQRLSVRDDPSVHDVARSGKHRMNESLLIEEKRHFLRHFQLVDRLNEKTKGVVPGQEDVFENVLHSFLFELQRFASDDGRSDQIQAQSVGAELLEDLHRIGIVLLPFGHLLAGAGENDAVDDQILERGLVEESGGDDEQRVEPTAGLINALGDEIGGKDLRERPTTVERVMNLSVGHRARLEPTVEDFGNATKKTFAQPRGNCDRVDELPVKIVDGHSGQFSQFFDRADTEHFFAVVADPEGHRVAPVPVARDGPVARLAKPIAETLLLDEVGNPVGLTVVLQQSLDHSLHSDEPRGNGAIDQRRVTSPAERVRVTKDRALDQPFGFLQILDDLLVRGFDVFAGEVRHFRREMTSSIDRTDQRTRVFVDHPVRQTDAIVVFTEVRRLVNDTRAALFGHVIVAKDAETRRHVREVGKQRRVMQTLQLGTDHLLQDLVTLGLLVQFAQSLFHQNELLLARHI